MKTIDEIIKYYGNGNTLNGTDDIEGAKVYRAFKQCVKIFEPSLTSSKGDNKGYYQHYSVLTQRKKDIIIDMLTISRPFLSSTSKIENLRLGSISPEGAMIVVSVNTFEKLQEICESFYKYEENKEDTTKYSQQDVLNHQYYKDAMEMATVAINRKKEIKEASLRDRIIEEAKKLKDAEQLNEPQTEKKRPKSPEGSEAKASPLPEIVELDGDGYRVVDISGQKIKVKLEGNMIQYIDMQNNLIKETTATQNIIDVNKLDISNNVLVDMYNAPAPAPAPASAPIAPAIALPLEEHAIYKKPINPRESYMKYIKSREAIPIPNTKNKLFQ